MCAHMQAYAALSLQMWLLVLVCTVLCILAKTDAHMLKPLACSPVSCEPPQDQQLVAHLPLPSRTVAAADLAATSAFTTVSLPLPCCHNPAG